MKTYKQLSIETGLARSSAMYPPAMYPSQVCGNGWRIYVIRTAREITANIYALAFAGDIEALSSLLRADGESAPRTVARSMIREARKFGNAPAIKWLRDHKGIKLGCFALYWSNGVWGYACMFSVR